MRSFHHALVVLLASSPSRSQGDGSGDDEEVERWERYAGAVRRLVCEYVLLAQQIQPLPRARHGAQSDTAANIRSEDGEADLDRCRLLLSINVLTDANAAAIASQQQISMERPVAVKRCRHPRLLDDARRKIDDCISHARNQQAGSAADSDVEPPVHDAFVRAMQWFENSSFSVSVIAMADGIPEAPLTSSRRDSFAAAAPSLADALSKLQDVQFILLRSDEERFERSSQNILHLLRAIKDSSNARCEIRQVESDVSQLRRLVKEWVYRAMPSVTAAVVHTGGAHLSNKASDSVAFCLDIRSNYLQQSSDGENSLVQMLHSGMSQMEILHIVPMSSIHSSVLVGCPLHGRPSGTATSTGSHAHTSTAKAFARFLRSEKCAAMLRCTRQVDFVNIHLAKLCADCGCYLENIQTRAEFFLLVPSENGGGVCFLLFRVASAEEVLFPPRSVTATEMSAVETVEEDLATLELIRQIPQQDFNPFQYESVVVGASVKARVVSAPGSIRMSARPAKQASASISKKTSGSKRKAKDKKISGTKSKTQSKRKSIKSNIPVAIPGPTSETGVKRKSISSYTPVQFPWQSEKKR